MQKKVLALAVAGLLSGAAFAQTTAVTFGGSIATDITSSTSHQFNSLADGTYKSKLSVDDSNWQGSRLWWKAQEDLGNGLGVEAYQEMRMRTDSRSDPVNRRSYLQLSSTSWGTIKGVGGFGNVLDDALGLSEAKSADWGKGVINPLIVAEDKTNDTLANTVQYITPDFSGFKLKLSASGNDPLDVKKDEEAGNGKLNVRALGFNASYLNGPIKFAVAHLHKSMDGNSLNDTIVSGMYDFGMFQLGAAYAHAKNNKLAGFAWKLYDNTGTPITTSTTDWKRNGFRINLGADITPMDHVGLSYSYAKVKFASVASGSDSANVKGLGLSYTHMLSKRTTFLAEFAGVSMDENHAPLKNTYERIVRVGMRHDF